MKLYFIRHGKTQWNLEGRFQGAGGDSPLLDESYQQMIQVGQFLRQTPFVHAYASPIKRARITAQRVIKELHQSVPLTLLNRLEEFHLGKMRAWHLVRLRISIRLSWMRFAIIQSGTTPEPSVVKHLPR
ncbi:Phosphoglycerate mutase family 5 [Levilactobacillus brevis]|nr:Phosphoglycerate mutase family 5 [Levilactobacillus brevis]